MMDAGKLDKAGSILDKPISRGKSEVSHSAFAYLFAEMVQYCQSNVESTQELEKKLADCGYGIGLRFLELLSVREKGGKREKSLISMLQYIHNTAWKSWFGKQADGLEKSTDRNDEYYIYDKDPITNKFISVPKSFGSLNCAAFVAGIVNGFLDGAEFTSTVTACFGPEQTKTVYVIRFEPHVLARDAA
jgi:hypothetical protein